MIDINKVVNYIESEIEPILDVTLELIKKTYLTSNNKGLVYKLIVSENSWDFFGPMNEEITTKGVIEKKEIELLALNASINNNFLITLDDFNLYMEDKEFTKLFYKYKDECIIANSLNYNNKNMNIDLEILKKFIKNSSDLYEKIIIDNIEMDWSVYKKNEMKNSILGMLNEL